MSVEDWRRKIDEIDRRLVKEWTLMQADLETRGSFSSCHGCTS